MESTAKASDLQGFVEKSESDNLGEVLSKQKVGPALRATVTNVLRVWRQVGLDVYFLSEVVIFPCEKIP
jgi:hypothetical protein